MATRIEVRVVSSGKGPRIMPPASRGSIIFMRTIYEMPRSVQVQECSKIRVSLVESIN